MPPQSILWESNRDETITLIIKATPLRSASLIFRRYEAIQLLGFHFGDGLIFPDVPLLGIVDQSVVQEWFTVMSVTKMCF